MEIGIARDVVGWLGVLVALTGFVVCAARVGRTGWAVALTVGFALQTVNLGFNRIAISFLSRGARGGSALEIAFLLSSFLGVVGSAAIVGGVAGVLSELKPASAHQAARRF